MKRSIITILIAITAMMAVHAQEKVIKPQSITPMPKISVEQWEKLSNQYEDDSEELWKYGDITVYDDLYSGRARTPTISTTRACGPQRARALARA